MSGSSDFTTTPNLGLFKPTYAADVGYWGTHLNANADKLDTALGPGGGVFLPLTGGIVSGATTFNGPLTGSAFGTSVGSVPLFQNYQGSGFASLGFPSRVIFYKSGSTTDTDFATGWFLRTTTHSGGNGGRVATALCVSTVVGAGVTNQEWALLANCTTNATNPSVPAVGGDLQGIRQPGSYAAIWGGVFDAIDLAGTASSVTPGAVLGGEVDVEATGADDGLNNAMFGGKGLRIGLQFVAIRRTTSVPLEVSHGVWFSTHEPTQAKYYSAVGFANGTQTHQALDTRGAVSPDTNPMASVRMLAGQIVDFNGGPALNSAPGAYLQYRTATQRLYYVVGGVDQWSVDASGNVRARGTVTGSTTP